jgi:hypothetical protein
MSKKIVHYKSDKLSYFIEGASALVHTVDHPGETVSNTKAVLTSVVIRVDHSNGEFETLNTIYRPLKLAS